MWWVIVGWIVGSYAAMFLTIRFSEGLEPCAHPTDEDTHAATGVFLLSPVVAWCLVPAYLGYLVLLRLDTSLVESYYDRFCRLMYRILIGVRPQ
jgi:glucan phosphoethanolaminetransferase (alkaline phosphatase superfamily)